MVARSDCSNVSSIVDCRQREHGTCARVCRISIVRTGVCASSIPVGRGQVLYWEIRHYAQDQLITESREMISRVCPYAFHLEVCIETSLICVSLDHGAHVRLTEDTREMIVCTYRSGSRTLVAGVVRRSHVTIPLDPGKAHQSVLPRLLLQDCQ